MENQRQKWVNLTFIAAAGITAFVVFSLTDWAIAAYDLEARIKNIDLIIRVASVALFGLIFLVLYRNDQAQQYINEVIAELLRVTWPTNIETRRATIVVMIMVLIAGLFLGGMDALWTWALKWVL